MLHRASAVRAAAIHQLCFCPEGFTFLAVKSFVCTLIDVSLVVHSLPDLLDSLHMSGLRGPDEIIIGDLHGLPEILDTCNYLINVFLRCHACFLSLGLDLLAVLVSSCQEVNVIALKTLESGHGISHDSTVSMPDVKVRAGIINRCGNIISSFI